MIKLNPELRVVISNVHYYYDNSMPNNNINKTYKSYDMLRYICGDIDSKYRLEWWDDDPEEIPLAINNTFHTINIDAFEDSGINHWNFIRNIPEVREYFDNLQLKAKDLNNSLVKGLEEDEYADGEIK